MSLAILCYDSACAVSKEPMHELSIAMAIIEAAEEESLKHNGARVTQVHLRLGALAGVVKEALQASYEAAAEQSSVAGSTLIIQDVPIRGFCSSCKNETAVVSTQNVSCTICGTPVTEIVAGRELEIVAMEITE